MICMIADYQERGMDKHRAYIAKDTDDIKKAVTAVVKSLEDSGADVQSVAVIPGRHSIRDLERIAKDGPRSGVAVEYRYDVQENS